MQVEQEYATPQEAYLAHYGKKGMQWGVRNKVDDVASSVSRGANSTKQSVKSAASKTSDSASRTVSNAKKSASGAAAKTSDGAKKTVSGVKKSANDKVESTKKSVNDRVQAKKDRADAKAKAIGENKVVKDVGHEFKGAAWGTRQAYIEKTLKDAERTANIAKGTAAIDSKVIAVKDGVVGKRSAKYANKVFTNHAKRMQDGELLTRDVLLMTARLRRRDLTIGMDIAGKANDAAKKRGRKDGAQFKIKAKLVKKDA